jgi:signal recognition particle subunit SRP54
MFDFLSRKFSEIVNKLTDGGKLSESNIAQALESVRDALLEADVPYELVNAFVASVKQDSLGKKVLASVKPGEQFVKIVYDQLVNFMGGTHNSFVFQMPSIVMVMGLQGSGKTTSIAKMVRFVQKEAEKKGKKRRVLMASVDFYRPAAIDQLEVLAQSVNASFFRATSSGPVEAAHEILNYYKKGSYELLFLDTAGRLHVDAPMLQELKKIEQIVHPRHTFLVLDAMTGQESLTVAKAFNEQVPFQGAMLTKLDSDTRGGAAFAFRYALKKPIIFVGTGEKVDDIDVFRPDRISGRILGMGDVLSLVEKAEEQVAEKDKQSLERSLRRGTLTLDDFEAQMSMVSNMGSLTNLMKYMPGMGSVDVKPEVMDKAEREMKLFRAVIRSMTPKERLCPQILDGSRKKRIANGAGVDVTMVNLLLQRFEESKQYVKLFKKLGRF